MRQTTKDILIFVFAFFVIFTIGFVFYTLYDVQRSYNKPFNETSELVVEVKPQTTPNLKLAEFLEHPIDLHDFKNSKDINYTTTGVTNGKSYYFQPNIKDSIFYLYNYPTENFTDVKRIDQIIVFKHGKKKHTYDDDTEILIELRIFNSDDNLKQANLVGRSKAELESEFGKAYLMVDNHMVYAHKNKVLILTLKDAEVSSYNYIKLNTETINHGLIQHIIK
ncbi:hypothetical protein [Psychroserpens luteolus]|uniref:hypothetical protein n=1 Tax=Psychroserpens luteolus TaxID=2855840 RepID=UPI001E4A31BC|nr:hypothetical protein [Psychroserpens luteolus]MCD2259770.1 hypothetical protein [Psychroserpens luteolus]